MRECYFSFEVKRNNNNNTFYLFDWFYFKTRIYSQFYFLFCLFFSVLFFCSALFILGLCTFASILLSFFKSEIKYGKIPFLF